MYLTDLPVESLDFDKITAVIDAESKQFLSKLEIFNEIGSTNSYLLEQAREGGERGWACLAETQTHGRGRADRTWYSPPGMNIYCSLLWQFTLPKPDMAGLSLAVAVMVAHTLRKYGIVAGIELKWPNDVMFAGRKLAGILLEQVADKIVIGIGLNLYLPPTEANENWIAMTEITGRPVARNYIAGLLLNELLAKLPLYQERGLSAFSADWRQWDVLFGKEVTVQTATVNYVGVMQGINQQGELILLNPQGEHHYFRCGEVSIRFTAF
jgi:BirA family biotin operon repressor/biotin-[acetyl-CoA-carboxylase] ligase